MQHDFKTRDARLRAPAIPVKSKTSSRPTAWLPLLLGALFLLLSATAAQAGTLAGTVLDPSGRPVPQAHVTLLRSLVVLDQRQTDSQGTFKFAGLADGKYQLVASAPGLASPQAEVEIRGAEVQTLDLHLQLSAVQQQVVVSASLGDSLASEVGSSVSVVSGQDIKDRAALNVLDVLSGIPGVEVSQAGRYGGVTGVYVRGGESNYNLVMVDGMELNEFGGALISPRSRPMAWSASR